VGAPIDLGGWTVATRMVGGFILVAFLLCILLAWPGRRRWPMWLISGLCTSLCAALAVNLTASGGWWLVWGRLATVALAAGFLATAAVRDLRDPLR
jgi:peptidoglycan/LPS O-acetylase OafA/YrhL